MPLNLSFQATGQDPASWKRTATWLRQSYELLGAGGEHTTTLMDKMVESGFSSGSIEALQEHMFKYAFVNNIALMLLGMSFENLMKGLIVAHDPSVVSQTNLDKFIATHNFEELANRMASKTGITLTAGEIALLHPVLTELNIWGGRYPVPMEQSKMANEFSWSGQMVDGLKALWQKLHDAI